MKRLILILFLVTGAVTAFAGDFFKNPEPAVLEVRYQRTEVYDTLHRDSLYFRDEMMLRIGKTRSMFCNVKRFFQDSLSKANPDVYWGMMKMEMDKGNPNVFATLGGHKRAYLYKFYTESEVVEEDYFDMTPWRYRETWEKPEWKIADESKEILGYECFKATTDYRGRRWEAWFAPEIPIQEGPWKLCGLPGLILESYDTGKDYVFEGCALITDGLGEVGICLNRRSDDYSDVTRDRFFANWWRYKHSDSVAKTKAAFGVAANASPRHNGPKTVNYDKEETDYPHDL